MSEPKTVQKGRQKQQEPDLEVLVHELDQRVDRLRACYDQYFMGIEKMPPHVQIKDVERRFQELRKIQIRNTALRFKFQTILQRHNTYQSYWQRIVRQIEEGTYKRDVRRATERFGPGQKRGVASATREIEIDIDMELEEPMSEASFAEPPKPAPVKSAPALDEMDAFLGIVDAPPPKGPPAPAPSVREFGDPGFARAAAPSGLLTLDSPDDGMPVLVPRAPAEERPSRKHVRAAAPPAPVPAPFPAAPPRPGPLPPLAAPKGLVPPRPVPTTSPVARPAPDAPRAPAPAPPIPAKPVAAPSPAAPVATAPAAPKPAAPVGRPAQPAVVVRPMGAPGAPARPLPQPAAPKPAPRREGDLSDERMRQLYGQYIEAKRARAESTAALTYDSLAKSLQESSAKIREKHGGKRVDFEVAEKDGKTILRPVVKDKP